jgi:hypothetical protein
MMTVSFDSNSSLETGEAMVWFSIFNFKVDLHEILTDAIVFRLTARKTTRLN